MADLPIHPTRIEKVLVEGPVPAWEGCLRCFGTGELPSDQGNYKCEICHGAGGKWHEAISFKENRVTGTSTGIGNDGFGVSGDYYLNNKIIIVIKPDQLIRKWKICPRCGNANHKDSCPDCLNNEGISTGAVPDSAGPWELVKE